MPAAFEVAESHRAGKEIPAVVEEESLHGGGEEEILSAVQVTSGAMVMEVYGGEMQLLHALVHLFPHQQLHYHF